MQIQCPVIRDGGSFVEVFGTEYHFKPQADGCHVAVVENPSHQDRLLEIGYRIYRPKVEAVNESAKTESKFSDLAGLDVSALSDDDLRQFAEEVMHISPKNKATIVEWHAKAFSGSEPLDSKSTVVELLRQCATAIVEVEKTAKAG